MNIQPIINAISENWEDTMTAVSLTLIALSICFGMTVCAIIDKFTGGQE